MRCVNAGCDLTQQVAWCSPLVADRAVASFDILADKGENRTQPPVGSPVSVSVKNLATPLVESQLNENFIEALT
jgi:hypothetical protein